MPFGSCSSTQSVVYLSMRLLSWDKDCSLAQIVETVDPTILFYAEYPYFSSVSPSLLRHFADSAHEIMAMRSFNRNSLVVEAASNDGYMLKNFAEHGIPVLLFNSGEHEDR